jgi:hypothetical protein
MMPEERNANEEVDLPQKTPLIPAAAKFYEDARYQAMKMRRDSLLTVPNDRVPRHRVARAIALPAAPICTHN